MLKDIIASGKFVSIEFVKKNGELSKVNGRVGVKRHLRGGSNTTLNHKEYITIYDVRRGYRNVNVNNIVTIKANKRTYDLGA